MASVSNGMNHLEGLNEAQKEAVRATEGPLLIIAGAGAGKTRVLTHRILHLITKGVAPEAILAITFTNKAAKEMRDRARHLLATSQQLPNSYIQDWQSPFISTFHGLGAHILREQYAHLGLPRHFTIFDKDDSRRAMKEALKRSSYDPKSFEPDKILDIISREKGEMTTLATFREKSRDEYLLGVTAEVWEQYERILKEERALDFSDLLLKPVLLLQKDEAVRAHYQNLWRYIHIDEYQDTNRVQYELARILSEKERNLAVVGDIDQNIYSWRGATIRNIMDFEKDYPDAKVVLLEENYRSTQTILTVANRIIEKNKERREKTLFTKNHEGEKLGFFVAYDESDEARFVAEKSRDLIAQRIPAREIAVLFRANFQSRALEEAFLNAEVPYQVLGTRFFERREVKDIIAYLRAALDETNLADQKRIVNVPPRGIGKVTLLKIFAGRTAELPPAIRERVAAFKRLLSSIKKETETKPLSEALRFIIKASGLEAELKKGGTEDAERLENIKELVSFAARYDHPQDGKRDEAVLKFLGDAALQSDQDELKEEQNKVRLMTVHASKGLEFEFVFITGLEAGLFPHERLDPHERNRGAEEEERRLFYVALTRAKKKIHLSYAGVRTVFGSRQVTMPSEFIFDIDEELLDTNITNDTNDIQMDTNKSLL